MARIRQIKNVESREQRLASKKQFRKRASLQIILRYVELVLLIAIAVKVYIKL